MFLPFSSLISTLPFLLLLIFHPFAQGNLPQAGGDQCGGDGWRHLGAKCVKLFPSRAGWNLAEINCAYQGGHHISVRDIEENRQLSDLARGIGPVWLGAAQFGQSRDYVWVDGIPFGGFEHWQHNVRPQFHRGKKCVKLDGTTGEWVQSCCRVPAASICQRPPPPKLPGPIEEDPSALGKEEEGGGQFRQ